MNYIYYQGHANFLLIYYIDINKKEIHLIKNICLFKKEDINDILQLKDGKILLCSSNNIFKLIDLLLKVKEAKNPFDIDYKLYQNFKGLHNSKNIFSLIELTNELIVSGDCEKIILWEKYPIKDDKSNYTKSNDLNGSESDNKIMIDYNYELKIIKSKQNFGHTYCMREIKNENNKIILVVAQPDSKSIIF